MRLAEPAQRLCASGRCSHRIGGGLGWGALACLMEKPPQRQDEPARLRTLREYAILDTASEESLDSLARLAAAVCGTPMALITFLDESRQWFKSRVGVDLPETPRDVAFCAYTIAQDGLFVVEDATRDGRFHDNPLVTSGPKIHFYAGAPLTVAGGAALGTLCVLDTQARQLTDQQAESLQVLGSAVVTQLELRRAMRDLDVLHRMLAMCAWCRRVRQGDGSWRPLEEYMATTVHVTHGMCPWCAEHVSQSPR